MLMVYETTLQQHGAKGNVSLYWVVYLHYIHVCNIQFNICDIYGQKIHYNTHCAHFVRTFALLSVAFVSLTPLLIHVAQKSDRYAVRPLLPSFFPCQSQLDRCHSIRTRASLRLSEQPSITASVDQSLPHFDVVPEMTGSITSIMTKCWREVIVNTVLVAEDCLSDFCMLWQSGNNNAGENRAKPE